MKNCAPGTTSPLEGQHPAVLSAESRQWLAEFWKRHHRRVRVLHIGNIANNAYNNAKLLNDAGLDCDVLCYDYYHAMGCPEWEDADFEGDVGDMFFPDWTSVNVNGFERPGWFAQGPVDLCVNYLIARREGNAARAQLLWRELGARNRSERVPNASGLRRAGSPVLAYVAKRWRILRSISWSRLLMRGNIDTRLRRLRSEATILGKVRALAGFLRMTVAVLAARLVMAAPSAFGLWTPPGREIERRVAELTAAFRSSFGSRADQLSGSDFSPYPLYTWVMAAWDKLYRHYDIVQAYSTDPILPLFSGRDYFAFEHGTLRDIPFSNTPEGRITAISYRLARHVFVTNFDCLDNARALAGDRVTLINHPYDEDHGLQVCGWETLRGELGREVDADFLFFFPTRHDWVECTGYADKANDVFLRAFAALRQRNHRVGMVCCKWGSNVSQSRQLLDALGCARHVKWVAPMGMVKFERMARACHCVVDQFKLGAFGGVMFKAMAVGSPVCTFLDERQILKQYPEAPPVINCRTEQEIVEKLSSLLGALDKVLDLGAGCRAWMKRYHSRNAVVGAQIEQYRRHYHA